MTLAAAASMMQGHLVELTSAIAIAAARLGVAHRLPLADSVMLASARAVGATLWTQDVDFEDIEGVKYVRKRA